MHIATLVLSGLEPLGFYVCMYVCTYWQTTLLIITEPSSNIYHVIVRERIFFKHLLYVCAMAHGQFTQQPKPKD